MQERFFRWICARISSIDVKELYNDLINFSFTVEACSYRRMRVCQHALLCVFLLFHQNVFLLFHHDLLSAFLPFQPFEWNSGYKCVTQSTLIVFLNNRKFYKPWRRWLFFLGRKTTFENIILVFLFVSWFLGLMIIIRNIFRACVRSAFSFNGFLFNNFQARSFAA